MIKEAFKDTVENHEGTGTESAVNLTPKLRL
jgi:hypothetical protein